MLSRRHLQARSKATSLVRDVKSRQEFLACQTEKFWHKEKVWHQKYCNYQCHNFRNMCAYEALWGKRERNINLNNSAKFLHPNKFLPTNLEFWGRTYSS
jgi:hypothetical protein